MRDSAVPACALFVCQCRGGVWGVCGVWDWGVWGVRVSGVW